MFTTNLEKENTEKSSLGIYLRSINKISLLTKKEKEYYGEKMWRGDEGAKKKIIEGNLRFVVNIAKAYQGNGLSLLDLIEEGNIGLINATEKFDYSRGYEFISYAVFWIRQAITKALASKSRTIRLPVNRYNESLEIKKVLEKMHDPSVEKIANETGISEYYVKILWQGLDEPISLVSTDNNGESYSLADKVEGSDYEYMQRKLEHKLLGEDIQMALNKLTEIEQGVITSRFGLDGEIPQTLVEVGEKYGFCKQRISQIEKKALGKLRNNKEDKEILKSYLS